MPREPTSEREIKGEVTKPRTDLTGKVAREREAKEKQPDGRGRRRLRAAARDWLRGAFIDHAALKGIALILALAVYFLVHSDEDAVIGANVGVSYTMPEERVLVSKPVDEVRITIRGSRRRVRRFDERELQRIHINLTNMSSGEFLFQPEMIKLPEGLELVSINPASMRLVFERRSEKSVKVKVETVGEPARGYELESIIAQPKYVTISGAESLVAGTNTLSTRGVVIEGRKQSFVEMVSLVPPEQYIDIVDDKKIAVEVKIKEALATRTIGEVGVEVRPGPGISQESASRFKVSPDKVNITLRGAKIDLDKLEPTDLHVYVEIFADDVVNGRSRDVPVIVTLPQGIASEISPAEVTLAPR